MSQRVAWVALSVGILVLLMGLFIIGTASSAFADLGEKLDLWTNGAFSRVLDLDIMGRNMQEEWDRSLLFLYGSGIISIILGGVLIWLGMATLLSPDDWRRR